MGPPTDYLHAFWNWAAQNGLMLLVAVNLVILVCAIGVAGRVAAISLRLKRLTLAFEQNKASSHLLGEEVRACAQALTAVLAFIHESRQMIQPTPSSADNGRILDQKMASLVREEIKSL